MRLHDLAHGFDARYLANPPLLPRIRTTEPRRNSGDDAQPELFKPLKWLFRTVYRTHAIITSIVTPTPVRYSIHNEDEFRKFRTNVKNRGSFERN